MPSKLCKDKLVQSSKSTPTPTTNKFDILSEDQPLKDPPKNITSVTTMSTQTLSTPNSNFNSMKNDITSMAIVLKSLTTSNHKMDKLDKIDIIESRQKFTDTKVNAMFTELRSELNDIEAKATETPQVTTDALSYANILKTSQKQNKNNTTNTTMALTSTPQPNLTHQQSTTITKTQANMTTTDDQNTKSLSKQSTSNVQTPVHATPIQTTNVVKSTPPKTSSSNATPNHQPPYAPIDIDEEDNEYIDDEQTSTATSITKTHKYWRLAASKAHQPHRFLQYMDNIKLNGDTISNLHQFYE